MSDYRTNNELLKTIAGDESSDYHTNNEYLKQIAEQGGGGGGTDNYANLTNKPKINNVVLVGDKTAKELGLVSNADFETLEGKVDELQLYKFPNAVIVGNPTINNGQISGFSQANYLKFPFLVDFKGKPFVIDMEFTTGANVTSQENIIDSDFGLAFAVRNGHFVIAIGSNGTSWDIGEGVGTYTVLANTAYKVKIAWNGSQYTVAYSVDGGENYTTDITKASNYQPYPTQIYIGVGENEAQVVNHFSGIVNLNNAELRIDNNIVWAGMDDVGLATRLATDLGNIDEAGIAKVKEIASDSVDLTGVKLSLTELKMLGWTAPEMAIKNEVSGDQFIQKIARVDLGSLNWEYRASDGLMLCQNPIESKAIAETDAPNISCSAYKALPRTGTESVANTDKSVALPNRYIIVHDSGYTDGAAFKTAVKGVYLYYELATPITTTIDGHEEVEKIYLALKNKLTRADLADGSIKIIKLYDNVDIKSEGGGIEIIYSDTEIKLNGGEIDIHTTEGDESRIRLRNGSMLIEGSPYADKNATIELKYDSNTSEHKSIVDVNADEVNINGKSQALYQHKVQVSGDDVATDGYWFYFPPFYNNDPTPLIVNDVEQTSPESERKHLQEVLGKLPTGPCGIDNDELHWCDVSFYNGVFIASKVVYVGGSYVVGQAKEIWAIGNWSELSDMSVSDTVTRIL